MKFKFDELRAAQSAACILLMYNGRANYMKVLYLLYLADRDHLRELGTVMAGASFSINQLGIFSTDIYICIKSTIDSVWSKYIKTDGWDIVLIKPPGTSELSDFNINIIDKLLIEHSSSTPQQILGLIQKLPEWNDDAAAASSTLDPEDIMRAMGLDENIIKETIASNKYFFAVDEMFANSK